MERCIIDCNPEPPFAMVVIIALLFFFLAAKVLKSIKDEDR